MAASFAETLFDAQDGDFSEVEKYTPEECVDDDVSCWVMIETNRIGCHRVEVDDGQWKNKIELSRVLTSLRKALPRVRTIL